MYAYLYTGYRYNSNVAVTKEPLVQVCMHTCTKGTLVTATLLLQRTPSYKYVYILLQGYKAINLGGLRADLIMGIWGVAAPQGKQTENVGQSR